MSIYEEIKNFPNQLVWHPEFINAGSLRNFSNIMVVGMGGSNLAAGLIKKLKPTLSITEHRNYGLPRMSDEDRNRTLFVISSYSGETEETLSALEEAMRDDMNVAIITGGGKLLSVAKENRLPFIELPEKNMHPRMALGYSFVALLTILGEKDIISDARSVSKMIALDKCEGQGQKIAEQINDSIPLIYSAENNYGIAYNWKIRINETGKFPAFYSLLPESAHNELASFSAKLSPKFRNFCIIILCCPDDHPRVTKKIGALEKIFRHNGSVVIRVTEVAENMMLRIFYSILIADYASYYLAQKHGFNPDESMLIEDFKRMI